MNKKIKTIIFNPLGKIDDLYDHELNWHDELNKASEKNEPTVLSSNDPLFILYTSGSTGTPKGLVHSSGGYLVHVHNTFKDLFNFKQDDIYWSTADIGWITGHSYGVYGPLSNGATILIFEGNPLYEDGININSLIEKHQVNIFYTAPTLIRSLMSKKHLKNHVSTKSSLKVLGSVGEPLNPEAWSWYYNDFGQQKCPIIDTWWQTETGGILIAPKIKNYKKIAGSAGTSINGTEGFIINNHAEECKPDEEGFLVFRDSWPGQAISIFGDHARFEKTYFEQFSGFYCSGDGAKKDLQNNFFITGRIDDVLNVSGHRMGTSEIESAIVSHKSVVEAGVIGIPDKVKGEAIFAFVAVDDHTKKTTDLKVDIKNWVKKEIGALAIPSDIELVSELPKTRSGKIMRRILKKIAINDFDNFGDISTLANPESVNELISLKKQ
ncbi:AMP-binding protein [Paraphotobacterium marinum]|uniref:AMP-binding protein n=1 Tax=Paraphotobacterium marinum TaxID=1755811 RepID=UPI0011AB54CD|nr:AMP-binding protein [Paraphotobacterium marinum]